MAPACFLGPNFKRLAFLFSCSSGCSFLQLNSSPFLSLFIQVWIKWSLSLKKRRNQLQRWMRRTDWDNTVAHKHVSVTIIYSASQAEKAHWEIRGWGSCVSLWPYLKDKVLGEIQFIQIIKTLLCKSTVGEHTMEIKKYLLYSVG